MEKWNWTAIGILTPVAMIVLGWLGVMVTNIRKDITSTDKAVAATNKALEVHITEDKAVAEDVKDLKQKVAIIEQGMHRMELLVVETNGNVRSLAVHQGLLPTSGQHP